MEKYTMFMHQQNQYSENEYTTQSNLQIQCIPIKIPMAFFTELEQKKNLTICMETQKTLSSQSNINKEKQSWRNQPP